MNCNREYTLYVKGENMTPATVEQINRWLENKKLIGWAFCRGSYDEASKMGEWQSFLESCWWEPELLPNGVWINGYDEDMEALSKDFPDVTFCLHGDGEEDEWNEYWLNGDCEHCEVEVHIPAPTRIKW